MILESDSNYKQNMFSSPAHNIKSDSYILLRWINKAHVTQSYVRFKQLLRKAAWRSGWWWEW